MAEMSTSATDFYEHPVSAFDPFYTRDLDNFHYQWNVFLKECRRLLCDYLQLTVDSDAKHWKKYACDVLNMVKDVLERVKGYERNSGYNLLHHNHSMHGHLVPQYSVLKLIIDVR